MENTFQLLGQDGYIWLEQAQLLMISAEVILTEFEKIREHPQVWTGIRHKKLSYIQSFMLLTGLAFENLIKGASIASNPSIVSQQKLDRSSWNFRKGHGLVELAAQITTITAEETHLLKRLEEYVVWAGRYPIPLNANIYRESEEPVNLKSFNTHDPRLISSLFDRLANVLKERAQERHNE